MRILVIDDDEDIREVLGIILSTEGHQVEFAVDGIDAMERLKVGSPPALILLDMVLPRLDGEGFLRMMTPNPRMDPTRLMPWRF